MLVGPLVTELLGQAKIYHIDLVSLLRKMRIHYESDFSKLKSIHVWISNEGTSQQQ